MLQELVEVAVIVVEGQDLLVAAEEEWIEEVIDHQHFTEQLGQTMIACITPP